MKKTILALCLMTALAAQASCYSEGVRVGTIQKFSQKGLITKSWEGELVMEGVKFKPGAQGGTSGGNVWAFSATDSVVAKVIDEATMTGGPVALRYCETNPLDVTRRMSISTSYVITQAVARK